MKSIGKLFLGLTLVGALFAFHEGDHKVQADIVKSEIAWTGKKIVGEHNGSIRLKEGEVTFRDGKLIAGEFVVDMTSIQTLDMKGRMASKLDGHLKSDDFFDVTNHPEAHFKSTEITPEAGLGDYTVKGDLTIRGTTKPISFSVNQTDTDISGRITVERTQYGIKYGSGSFFDNLGDKAIDDNFYLDVKVVFLY